MKKIAVHLAEGFEEIEAVSIIDVLRRADFEVVVVSVSGENRVTGSHQIQLVADVLFEEVEYGSVDMIVLPGGMPGAGNLKKHEGLRKQILDFNENGKPLGAICAAPIVLGDLGILQNKKVTCYPGFENELKGAKVTSGSVEQDGNIITGKGAGVAIQFALKLVEQLKSPKEAEALAQKMVVNG